MEKMWAGRFLKELDREADDFNSSIHFDCRMFRQDIEGSIAHAGMLAKQGIISKAEGEEIIEAFLKSEGAFPNYDAFKQAVYEKYGR